MVFSVSWGISNQKKEKRNLALEKYIHSAKHFVQSKIHAKYGRIYSLEVKKTLFYIVVLMR